MLQLLLQVLLPYLETLDPSSPLAHIAPYLPKSIPSPLLELFHDHSSHAGTIHSHAHEAIDSVSTGTHGLESALASHGGDAASIHSSSSSASGGALLNPHAAWFALISVVLKEWLYRATKKVAEQEHSPVLEANALQYVVVLGVNVLATHTLLTLCVILFPPPPHSHRSDALTSGVALFSILGSAAGAPVLDPLGGLAVSFFILKQGLSMSKVAAYEVLDKGVDQGTRQEIVDIVDPLVNKDVSKGGLLGVRNVRAVKSGGESPSFPFLFLHDMPHVPR